MTISGSGFSQGGATTTSIEIYIDGIKQEVVSINDTEIVVKLTDLENHESTNVELYFPVGRSPDYAKL